MFSNLVYLVLEIIRRSWSNFTG